ncbi:hypothetical protein ElyMa_000456000 [Elysia marginata]|uniref:Uncharacterized protein n=1 Tax=Elysia marginata TaxID=1093978 RepID=A0AAV4FQK0_9GAST|nr:hypothetical protein ElyMa_000456000 [Elysia marginata]
MEDESRGGSEGGGTCAGSKDAGKKNRRHRSSRFRQKSAQQQQTTMATTADVSTKQSSSSQGDETADSSSSVDGGSISVNKTIGGNSSPTHGSTSASACGGESLKRVGSSKGGVLFNLDESSTSNEENTEAEEELGPLGGRQPSLSSQASLDAVSAAAAAIMTDPALHTPKMRRVQLLCFCLVLIWTMWSNSINCMIIS